MEVFRLVNVINRLSNFIYRKKVLILNIVTRGMTQFAEGGRGYCIMNTPAFMLIRYGLSMAYLMHNAFLHIYPNSHLHVIWFSCFIKLCVFYVTCSCFKSTISLSLKDLRVLLAMNVVHWNNIGPQEKIMKRTNYSSRSKENYDLKWSHKFIVSGTGKEVYSCRNSGLCYINSVGSEHRMYTEIAAFMVLYILSIYFYVMRIKLFVRYISTSATSDLFKNFDLLMLLKEEIFHCSYLHRD